ncbi:Protein kinase-like domain protein [Ophiocordyceps camponoti-floridani]|uniref:Protein kinase-like domain protein n=1 Tax=Ophiocordyceps camponoti-floridani TaxID=2030778 RepID=A0A8H4QBX4_9HYPO|nr:Protein kinase-like domain protein [Ophiocordyceps camponoti-floridani]
MELSQQSIHDVIHPTAAFSYVTASEPLEPPSDGLPWEKSSQNPKNRIDSLDPLENPLWRIDGCTAFGTQLYAVPLFIRPPRPYRVDFFIPEPAKLPTELRKLLDLDITFYTRDRSRISQLGITRHVLRILQHWTLTMDDPSSIYRAVPFGSRIVVENLPSNVADAQISIAPAHHLERQLLSVSALRRFWGNDLELPPTVDIDDVEYVEQLHDSVCLVIIDGSTCIFKAITSYTKYLYHELRQLLLIPPHPNIIARPLHLVTKRCGFGNKVAVVGFTVENHVHGSLRDLIPFLQLHGQISLKDKVKWSLQLASALRHLRKSSREFYYSDSRLDNVVLSESGDVVMVDFEQRGVWCEFAAPEVNAIEYVRLLAVDDKIDASIRDKYARLLTGLLPGWEKMDKGEDYTWPSCGYNVPWSCLSRTEQEACEVYMLGRVLWCILEASSAPQRAAVWLSYRWEPAVEFPDYSADTPEPLCRLINWCTRGRQPGLSKHIVRERDRLVMRHLENTGRSTAQQVQQTAREWWTREIADAERWLADRSEGMARGDWRENYYDRPTLDQVCDALAAFGAEIGVAAS